MSAPDEAMIYIVDDDEAVRKSLMLLMKTEGLPARCFASAREFLETADFSAVACVLLDVKMPGMSGLEVQDDLQRRGIDLPLIFMTGHGDVPMAVQAMGKGAYDFIEKPFDNTMLLTRLGKCLDSCRARQQENTQRLEASRRLASLTPREREVMDLLVAGNQNKHVASSLGISCRTVELHRARIMQKLEARSISEIVRIALNERQSAR
jgi:FixJ family two-component response regulator